MPSRIHIGPAGWSYPDWAGVVYPRPRPRGFDPLAYLASYFNLVEVDSTFYHLPPRARVRTWVERVAANPGFRFTAKAHRALTHDADPPAPRAVDAMRRALDPLAEAGRLTFVLLQFPWRFRDTPAARRRVAGLVRALHPWPVAVELRHGGWRGEGVDFVADTGATVCAVDQPAVGDSLARGDHRPGPHGAYFRLHGRNRREWFRPDTTRDRRYDYRYAADELRPVAREVRDAARGGRPVVVVMNNHFRGQAAGNAVELRAMVDGGRVAAPPPLVAAYPDLRAVADPVGPAPAEDDLFAPPPGRASTPEQHQEDQDDGPAGDRGAGER